MGLDDLLGCLPWDRFSFQWILPGLLIISGLVTVFTYHSGSGFWLLGVGAVWLTISILVEIADRRLSS